MFERSRKLFIPVRVKLGVVEEVSVYSAERRLCYEMAASSWFASWLCLAQGCSPSETPKSRKTAEQSSQISLSDIQILEWHLDRESGRTRVVGELRNDGAVAMGVQLQAIARDKGGRIVDSAEWWPASVSNIPAGSSWPIGYTVSHKPDIETVIVRVIRVQIWN
jgi:hypothetical protein